MKPVLCMYCELVEVRLFPDQKGHGVMVLPAPTPFVYGNELQMDTWVLKVRTAESGRKEGFVVPLRDLADRDLRKLTHVLVEHHCAKKYRKIANERLDAMGVGGLTPKDLIRVEETRTRRRPGR